jgi:AcrR family transcriptional regulator
VRHTKHRHLEQEEVVVAAVSVAFDLGLPMVTTSAVATRLGVPDRSVTAVWPDVQPLVATTFTRIVAAELAEIKREVLGHPSPVEQLQVLLELLAEPGRLDVDAVWLESWSLGRRNAALAEAVRSEEAAWHTFLTAVIRRGVRSGDHPETDPEEVATHLLAVIDGVNAYSMVGYHTDLDRLRLLQAVARTHLGRDFDRSRAEAQPETASLSSV